MDPPGHKKVFTAERAEAAEMNIEEKLNKITETIIGVAIMKTASRELLTIFPMLCGLRDLCGET